MALAAFPSSLPLVMKDGFSDEGMAGYVEFEADKPGAGTRTAVTTKAPAKMGFSMTVTAAQYATLDDFYRTDLKHGALRFTWAHPVTGVAIVAQFIGAPKFGPKPNVPSYLATVQLKYWRAP